MSGRTWHLLTGEYPPQPGGISDYTAQLAAGLARGGGEVHVWAPPAPGRTPEADGVVVHREAGRWSPADLARLDSALERFARPRRLVVQHTPNAWGYKGLNLGFCRWLVGRSERGDDVRLMFHEVFYPWLLRDRPTRWMLAAGQRWMTRTLLRACSRAYVSIPHWERCLRAYEPRGRRPVTWLPVPSNIPVRDDPEGLAAVRGRIAPGPATTLIGTFGTFHDLIAPTLADVFPRLLGSRPDRVGLLLGRGGGALAGRLLAAHPALDGRLIAAGDLPAAEVSLYLQACDLLIQPYPDGLTSRRTTLMAGLAHGVAMVSNLGPLSEPIWDGAGAPALVSSPDPPAFVRIAEGLLGSPDDRARVAGSGRELYRRHFALEHTIAKLIDHD